MWYQKEITLPAFSRGFHIIMDNILEEIPEIRDISSGLLHLFIKHTSASLTINENGALSASKVSTPFNAYTVQSI